MNKPLTIPKKMAIAHFTTIPCESITSNTREENHIFQVISP